MKKIILITLCLLIGTTSIYPWSGASHRGITRAAAKAVFTLDTVTKVQLSVPVKYDMSDKADFGATIGMGFGGTFGSVFSAFIGSIIDQTVIASRFKVDTTMKYNSTMDSIFTLAGSEPDEYDATTGLIGNNCLLGHACAPNGIGFCDLMAQLFYNKAVDAWKNNKKNLALVYLGYASHYMEDAGIPVHAEADYNSLSSLQWQWTYHNFLEGWIANNWSKYQATADSAAKVPMPVCDIPATVRSLALEANPDIAEWNHAWGYSPGGEQADYKKPANEVRFDELVRQAIWRCVPRIAGLFMKFKTEVMK